MLLQEDIVMLQEDIVSQCSYSSLLTVTLACCTFRVKQAVALVG